MLSFIKILSQKIRRRASRQAFPRRAWEREIFWSPRFILGTSSFYHKFLATGTGTPVGIAIWETVIYMPRRMHTANSAKNSPNTI
ncbi:hypothetical protein THIOM_003068 [Candidatus Thiomargarita nelsonii]|uniref:Uncharacterized protein n=1 Tax=Candidatus Thiomargarita nelsonii TaxID=1003181 RepID=A0A176RZN0_9GAMM|nr:hypothetical protein THIOM_003068 [Candidatus Thiomargarita nelsonii]